MKNLIFTLIPAFAILFANAQAETSPLSPPPDTTGVHGVARRDSIAAFFGEQPIYKGGEAALFSFISKNIMYPQNEVENEIEGLVMVEFVVERDGTTSGHKIVRGVNGGPGLEREALRVAKLIRFEKPGMNNNVPVRTRYNLPFRFELD
jgi:periplasmic protein TonB